MRKIINNYTPACWWIGALLCANLTACSSDSTIQEEDVYDEKVAMQFYHAVTDAPLTRSAQPLQQGFLVSCWKNFEAGQQQVVMDKYQVNLYVDNWNYNTKWDYVSSASRTFYKPQIERYWDFAARPYRFYAITPCPENDQITDFELTDKFLSMPTSVYYKGETCTNGVVVKGEEPYMAAQIRCTSARNDSDYDLLNGDKLISKEDNGATTTLDRYVALPFHHLTSKVRFAIYSTYKSNNPTTHKLKNIVVKAHRKNGFVASANGYKADLESKNMLDGQFLVLGTKDGDYTLLTDEKGCDTFHENKDESKAYWCHCLEGILQIPQDSVSLKISFTLQSDDFAKENITDNENIKYDETTHTLTYTDIPVTAKIEGGQKDLFTWKSNYIYTYIIKISEFYPIRIECTAELTPWSEISGDIETDLEK
jgi:hypothetical protein